MKLITKKFSPIILTISFILLIYTFYKSEVFWDGENRNYYKIYYYISSILICFSIITFFVNYKIKKYLIISCISFVLSLYLFEAYVTFEKDSRTKLEIYKDLKKINDKTVVAVKGISFVYNKKSFFSLSGISNSKTINCNENGYYSIYQSDRYGFNNPDEEWDKKEIEYLLVGDSFVQGNCVNRPNDISSVLRKLSNKSVLNLGIQGNGPLKEYASLKEYLDRNVKKVLWIYYEGNDLADLENEMKNTIFINYLKDINFTQNLKFKQDEIDNSSLINLKTLFNDKEKKKEGDTLKYRFIKFIKIYNTRVLILPESILTPKSSPLKPKSYIKKSQQFKKILKLAREFTDKNNSKLYFIYLPEFRRYKTNYDNTNYHLVKKIVNELNIPFIDIHKEVFEKELNPLILFSFQRIGHYNVEGYKRVAETVYKFTRY